MAGTVIPTLTAAQIANLVAELYPNGWSSSDAKYQPTTDSINFPLDVTPGVPLQTDITGAQLNVTQIPAGTYGGGVLSYVLLAISSQLAFVLTQLQYAKNAILIGTETSPELDLASLDYFGGALPRPPGMSDAQFAKLILSNLFLSAATRQALSDALFQATGVQPRMLETWNPGDTGAWDARVSYWDVDTRANPARWSDYKPYQGFIETARPSITPIGPNNPVLTFDDSAYWDVPGYFFGEIAVSPQSTIYSLLNRLHAYGTIVWVKFVDHPK